MGQFDLIDDYLTNRLSGESKRLFEEKMATDNQLNAEVDFQQSVIEGIKKARITELKSMMNNVPVGGAGALSGKLALAAITVGIVATLLYYLAFNGPVNAPSKTFIQAQETVSEKATVPLEAPKKETALENPAENRAPEKATKTTTTSKPLKQSGPPKVDVVDPTQDIQNNLQETATEGLATHPEPMSATIEVSIDNTNKAYPFHYQFIAGKLVLYGPFNAGLYEVIQINGTTQTAFLYYNGKYYHLDEQESKVTPLIMIRDNMLLGKLDQYRNRN